jgi:hypothetical protein
VVLMGYPTGVDGILARAGSDVVRKIAAGSQDLSQIMSRIAAQQLIRPTTTQGHIGDVLQDKIVYDAATTQLSTTAHPSESEMAVTFPHAPRITKTPCGQGYSGMRFATLSVPKMFIEPRTHADLCRHTSRWRSTQVCAHGRPNTREH